MNVLLDLTAAETIGLPQKRVSYGPNVTCNVTANTLVCIDREQPQTKRLPLSFVTNFATGNNPKHSQHPANVSKAVVNWKDVSSSFH